MNKLKLIARKIIRIYVKLRFSFYKKPKIVSIDKTIDYILETNCSVSRYGDGELRWMIGESTGYKFQENNSNLACDLFDIVNSNIANHIVCIPNIFEENNTFVDSNRVAWDVHLIKYGKKWFHLLETEKVFYDANMTRFYIDYKDKKKSEMLFTKIKLIWESRNIIIVEGEYTRFGVGNNLLSNASKISRILCPSENAYASKEKILEITLKQVKESHDDSLVLIALGPTATVLAAELALQNVQAIDIGHLDLEYEWFVRGDMKRTKIKNKYVNEVEGGTNLSVSVDDTDYTKQIVKKLI